jgi:hypothetical protein
LLEGGPGKAKMKELCQTGTVRKNECMEKRVMMDRYIYEGATSRPRSPKPDLGYLPEYQALCTIPVKMDVPTCTMLKRKD